MNYAVIKTAGKQYIVRPNETLVTDKIEGNAGDKIKFEEVLLVVDGDNAQIGAPILSSFQVEGTIVNHVSGEKVRVGKYKSKSRYHKVRGFRPKLTEIMIESIKGKSKGGTA